MLQDDDRGRLVYYSPPLRPPPAAIAQDPLSAHRSQPLVAEANRHVEPTATDLVEEAPRESERLVCCRAQGTGHGQRQPNNDLDRFELLDEVEDPGDVTAAAAYGLHRCREHTGRVARGDADTDFTDVDTESDAWPGCWGHAFVT